VVIGFFNAIPDFDLYCHPGCISAYGFYAARVAVTSLCIEHTA